MDSERLRVEGEKVIDIVANYWDTLRERKPLPDVKPGFMKHLVPPTAPTEPEDWEKIYADLEKVVWNTSAHWIHPHFYAYYPTGISYHSILADILSGGLSSVGVTWQACPSITELEKLMMDWVAELIGLPEHFQNSHEGPGCGIIQGSGSDCTLIAILTARAAKVDEIKSSPSLFRRICDTVSNLFTTFDSTRPSYDSTDVVTSYYHDPDVFQNFVMYFCDQGHSSVEKAAWLAGVKYRKLRAVKGYLGNYGLDPEALRKAIEEDRNRGYIPFMLVATIGTTSTCGVDELEKLIPICKSEGLYVHVDSAYAGVFGFCEEYRYLLNGVEDVDSFSTNLHKAGQVNWDCAPMWFKNGTYASKYYNVDPVYLLHDYQASGTEYRHLGIALSRRFRSLKVWFLLTEWGIEGIQDYQRNTVELAILFSKIIVEDEKFELFVPPTLGVVTFRLKDRTNEDNKKLYDAINKDRRVHFVPSTVQGTFILRVCIASPLTNAEDVIHTKKVIFEIADKLFFKN